MSLAKQQSYPGQPLTPVTILPFSILPPDELRRVACLTLCQIDLYNVVCSMTSHALEGNGTMAKPESLLEPLPHLNLITNVEKLDAGLRSLDHCELSQLCSIGFHC